MDTRQQLARNCTAESKAYGYTLTIWGGGALLIHFEGVPTVLQTFLYVTGAVLGFGVLAVVAYRGVLVEHERDDRDDLIAVSTVHVLSTLGNLLVAYALILATRSIGAHTAVFGLVGFQATFTYNLLLPLENLFARFLRTAAGVGSGDEA